MKSRNFKLREGKDEVTSYPSDMHIVYHHVDPETTDVVYVGEGKIDRGFQITHRTLEHHKWLVEKLEKFDIQEIVRIKGGNYTKKEAKVIEAHEIKCCLRKGCNLFNVEKNPYRSSNAGHIKLSNAKAESTEDSEMELQTYRRIRN